jgi:NAD(P)-dependent dehydrogenase (short-subunit alcohol dehydrogenase family)
MGSGLLSKNRSFAADDAAHARPKGIAESFPASAFVGELARSQGKSREEIEREFFEHARPTSLLKRFATTDEVAAMIVYLCSEPASATTGSAVRVDGGVVRAIV